MAHSRASLKTFTTMSRTPWNAAAHLWPYPPEGRWRSLRLRIAFINSLQLVPPLRQRLPGAQRPPPAL